MIIKLRCINNCILNNDGVRFYRNDIVNATICDSEYGIRIQKPYGTYSLPYYISDIETCFVGEGVDQDDG